MRIKDRTGVAYVVLKGEKGPYEAGASFNAQELSVDEARLLLDGYDGALGYVRIAEVLPGEDPHDVFERETAKPAEETPADEAAAEEPANDAEPAAHTVPKPSSVKAKK